LAGVEVGEVTGVFPDFSMGQVVVTWEVDRGVDVGSLAEAKIALGSLLGGNYIKLSGPVEEPFMADLPVEQRRIPLERTSETVGVIEAFDAATRTIDELDS